MNAIGISFILTYYLYACNICVLLLEDLKVPLKWLILFHQNV